MDFEFSMLNKTSIVLLSGALSNSLDRFKICRLEGRPLLLPKNGGVRPISDREIDRAVLEIKRIFRTKLELRDNCLKQLSIGLKSDLKNLNPTKIKNYLDKGGVPCALVFWNGSTDRTIVKGLGLGEYPMFNITCYDVKNNQIFFLRLIDMRTSQIIYEFELGSCNKSGRLLNLVEAHSLYCNKKHKITHAHDPKTDVRLTKCIFDLIIRKCRYENLIKYF